VCIFGAERTCRRVARQFTTPATRTNWSAMGTGQNSSDNLSWQVREKCCGSHDFQWASIEFDQLVYQPVDVFIPFRGTVSVATRQLNFLIELGIYHMGRFQDWVCTKKGWLPEGKFLRVQGLSFWRGLELKDDSYHIPAYPIDIFVVSINIPNFCRPDSHLAWQQLR
jgi:hypothetical protein